MASSPPSRIPALTGLRAIAAFWVLMLHYGEKVTAGWPAPVRHIFSSGFIGVDLFFVLSGFILSWNYLRVEGGLTVSRGEFWRARAARILPVYYVTLALGFPVFMLMQFSHGVTPSAVLSAIVTAVTTLTLTQSWVSPFSYLWNNPGWSLSVEVSLYLAFPWVACRLARKGAGRVVRLALTLYGSTILAAFLFVALHAHPSVWKWEPAPDYCIWISWLGCNPVTHFHEFLLGAVAYLWLREEQSGRRRVLMSGPTAVWIASVALITLAAWPGLVPLMPALVGIWSPLFALLIYGLAKQRGVIAAVLSTRAFVFLGEISYSLYLIHLIVWWNLEERLAGAPALRFLVSVAASLALSAALYKFIEVPYRRTLRLRFTPASPANTADRPLQYSAN